MLKIYFLIITAALLTGCVTKQPKAPEPIRVMAFNIHHGRGMDGQVNLERIAEVIKQAKADLVGLQEVDRGVERSGRRDLPAELAKLTGMHVYFAKNIDYQGGEYGNAILSRYPILQKTNLHYKMLRPKEQRGLLQVVVDVNGKQLLFMSTHIDYREDNKERLSNVEEIKQALKKYPGLPAIVVGDFNDYPNTEVHLKMKESFVDAWEAAGQGNGFTHKQEHGEKNWVRIDYIWFKGDIEPLRMRVVDTPASDHLPAVLEMRLK